MSGLSIGFSPPTGATLEVLGTEENAATLAAAAALLDAETGGGLADRARAFLGFCSSETVPVAVHAGRRTGGGDGPSEPRSGAGSPWTTEPLSQAYTRLFGHTARGGVSPYETEYGDDTLFQKPQELSDIAGFLRAFGLVLDPRTRERIDHVSCELEFMAFLARKEAYAAEIDDQPMRAETRRTSGLFLKDHLGRVVPSFARSVLKEDPDGFYGALAALCLEFVESDCTRFGVPIGPSMLRLRNVIDDGAPIACGTDHCPALPRDEEGRP